MAQENEAYDDKEAVREEPEPESGSSEAEAAARRREMRNSAVQGGGDGNGVPQGQLEPASEPWFPNEPSNDELAARR
ncbi:MAG TPA: hypothetical protein VMR98_00225, partial [Candidatus Polarisedimenticolaceae bacterium]|nr:hypothetical protein [Candidatus Polarisedimenticolaceae bacterium]